MIKSKGFFITVNDIYSGIYQSQVIDVIQLVKPRLQLRLVALVPMQFYTRERKVLRKQLPNALVLPMVFGIRHWHWHVVIVSIILKGASVWARGPMAAWVAQKSGSKRLIYDGRAAVKAELEEFDLVSTKRVQESIIEAEKSAVLNSGYRLAVSAALVSFWKNEYHYTSDRHVVIPSTASNVPQLMPAKSIAELKQRVGFTTKQVILCFSGGNGAWNNPQEHNNWFLQYLTADSNHALLFLTPPGAYIAELERRFPEQIKQLWVNPKDVSTYLQLADYGLLLRSNQVTNQVASPVKFAEYLVAGLPVIVSPVIADFAKFVQKHAVGQVSSLEVNFDQTSAATKIHCRQAGIAYFTKKSDSIRASFNTLINYLSGEHDAGYN